MNTSTILVVFTVAFVCAVGLFLYGVARILFGVFRYYLDERKPTLKIHNQALGTLEGKDGIWSGRISLNSRSVPFSFASSESPPPERFVNRLKDVKSNWQRLEAKAVEFLQTREPKVEGVQLEIYSIHLESDSDLTLEFIPKDDDQIVWRVEFEHDRPIRIEFDD